MQRESDNLSELNTADSENCSVCRDLLAHMGRFFDMIDAASKSRSSGWLTVDDIARELRISKSIVYRLIRQGELEAVDIAINDKGAACKGHYRVKKSALSQYLESKKVRTMPKQTNRTSRSRRFPKVKNHLGL